VAKRGKKKALRAVPKLQLSSHSSVRTPLIVVASNLTRASDSAIRYALYLAPLLTARVLLLHVIEHVESKRGGKSPLVRHEHLAQQEMLEFKTLAAERQLTRQLRRVNAEAEGVTVAVRSGRVEVELLAATRQQANGLLLLGRAKRGATLGKVAERVLRGARIPVIIVPPPLVSKQERPAKGKLRLVTPLRKKTGR
jgi:nucleotide-binding universal stress UspA family protein